MDSKDMHYDFKKKLNKVDSQKYKNLLIPEIDWVLNEAQDVFIDIISEPRLRNHLGFEKSQKNTDDIRTLVVDENDCKIKVVNNIAVLPGNYKYYVSSTVIMSKGSCTNVRAKLHVRQHDDDFENSPFDNSSFEWRTVNGVFNDKGIKLFTDGTFKNDELHLAYIRKPAYIHNAESFRDGKYKLPSGVLLTGHQNCELPESTHREIVDIAVMITTGELQIPDYQIKYAKLGLNQLK